MARVNLRQHFETSRTVFHDERDVYYENRGRDLFPYYIYKHDDRDRHEKKNETKPEIFSLSICASTYDTV